MVRMGTDVDGDGRVDRWDRGGDGASEPTAAPASAGEPAAAEAGSAASGAG